MSDKVWMTGTLAGAEKLAELGANFAKAAEFLKRGDLATLAPGRVEIDGERVFAVVNGAAELVAPAERRAEVHERYYDIQVPLTGEETYGVGVCETRVVSHHDGCGAQGETRVVSHHDGLEAQGREQAGEDLWFLTGVALEYKTIRPGEFMVFAPKTCAHAPAVSLTGRRVIGKIVVKVLA